MVWNKQTHRTSSWDRANYVFRICSMALWAFMPLSLLIHSIGLDISQEQPTALIPSAKTGHREFAGCGMSLIIGVQMGAEYLMAEHALTPPPPDRGEVSHWLSHNHSPVTAPDVG